MDTRNQDLAKTLSNGLFTAATLGFLLTAFGQGALAEIILGGPAPGASAAGQTAQYNRQRAIVEQSRNDNGEFWVSPNIILNDGYYNSGRVNALGGINTLGGVGGAAASGSAAGYGAAYNRQRAVVNQVFMGDHPPSNNRERANAYRTGGN
ncbi:conserved exported hypothetical protein [Candidatus Accumulibacter aalborgensis]|uniref:Uncharacterized protein n=2 Tax=Candidatus Accumulibacter aalborgensis TaxID=1860102 RepID=A0A1A8XDT6_9PROT|nr:conserved exported hypothetical protein [Candidatus Accumulibacter aalborgensis]